MYSRCMYPLYVGVNTLIQVYTFHTSIPRKVPFLIAGHIWPKISSKLSLYRVIETIILYYVSLL